MSDALISKQDLVPMLAASGIALLDGFLVPVGANLLYIKQGNPLVKKYRATLSYQSALWGDGLLIPLLNMVIARSLRRTGVAGGEVARAAAIGSSLTAAAQIYQAAANEVNWQMPKAWRWTALGYFHMLHMASEVSFLSLFFTKTVGRLFRKQAVNKAELALIAAGVVAFALMLALDYQDSESKRPK